MMLTIDMAKGHDAIVSDPERALRRGDAPGLLGHVHGLDAGEGRLDPDRRSYGASVTVSSGRDPTAPSLETKSAPSAFGVATRIVYVPSPWMTELRSTLYAVPATT